MRQQLANLPLATKTTIITISSLLLLALATYVLSDRVLTADAERMAAERQETNMRVAWKVLRDQGDGFRAEGGDLYVGAHKLNGWTQPVDEIKTLVGGTATIFAGDTRITTNVLKPDGSRAVGTPLAAGPAKDAVLGDGKPYRGSADILGKPFFTAYDPIKDASGKVIGVLYVGIPRSDVLAGIQSVRSSMAIAATLITLLVTVIGFLICRAMFRPLSQMTEAMQHLAAGDAAITVPEHRSADEIGQMARALERFRVAANDKAAAEAKHRLGEIEREKAMAMLGGALERVAGGDLTADVGSDFPTDFAMLGGNYNAALASLRELIGTVLESTGAIQTGSSEIAAASEDLARRTEGNAASLEETSAAVTQMNQRLRATADAAGQTVTRADAAIAVVGSGRATADEAVQAMNRVSDSAKGIDSVIEGLDKIAFQTRVLAMNAAVEAGRAGEAGRGFAVVADLVSALAMRAEEEAKRARDQLTVTQAEVETARGAVERVDTALSDIVDTVGEVHQLLGTIAADNQAQSMAISEVSTAISSMDQATQQNAAMVEETSAAARTLTDQVGRLDAQASTFRIGDGRGAPAPRTFKPLASTRPVPAKPVGDAEAWASF
ncbi:methyl-accepting chemotaxis protein [Sphingomonas kyeonggiensis]|uniref:Methyl-accepting chemotaxis protein n=1 Tax=Sphingomonas kyeonggiensis TaxID=1268553 RepID=A0A7W6JRQ4_9SPHN|nr:cache domain-containing protein [Sphingomonas kyeonggiensis]MBB4097276.1 methyl-accepting chemotaxis protein [Sphingomonas kyeonggiensis]